MLDKLLGLLVALWICQVDCRHGLAQARTESTFRVYVLAGQSNMEGYGKVAELPVEFVRALPDVLIFHANSAADNEPPDGRGIWEGLKPGHGVEFRFDGEQNRLSKRFGIELSFATRIQELHPGEHIALIKYARGGTSLSTDSGNKYSGGTWDPHFNGGQGRFQGINQYDHFLAAIANATAVGDVDGDKLNDALVPCGIVWLQGESDGLSEAAATHYQDRLSELMQLARASLRSDDLPIVIGRIADSGKAIGEPVWPFGEKVREAQAAFCKNDAAARLFMGTDNYAFSDRWHYDSRAYLDLGQKLADAMFELEKAIAERTR